MNEYIVDLIDKYSPKGVLVDTNVLLLLFMGRFDRKLVGKDNRLSSYVPEDYDILLGLLNKFKTRVTTPNILTEVSNLSRHLLRDASFNNVFARTAGLLEEQYVASHKVLSVVELRGFGLADVATMEVAKHDYLVLTDDFRLRGMLRKQRVDALNFSEVRFAAWSA